MFFATREKILLLLPYHTFDDILPDLKTPKQAHNDNMQTRSVSAHHAAHDNALLYVLCINVDETFQSYNGCLMGHKFHIQLYSIQLKCYVQYGAKHMACIFLLVHVRTRNCQYILANKY